ncbi:MAG TPA: 6-carboxytetrahydropterin synthase [Fimbriimonadaceae bacterium]|nr:6-carboxytetrahydropterin synthase [Fimbriimonadaceae bacterium]
MAAAARPVYLTRRVMFSSGHRYWWKELSAEENRELFGQFASPYNHGHNYVLDVTVSGRQDPRTAMVVNIKTLDAMLQTLVVERFDNKSINDEVPEMEDVPPTLESLIGHIRRTIAPTGWLTLDGKEVRLEALRLEEHPQLWGDWKEESMKLSLTRSYEFAASHRLQVPGMTEEENTALFGKCNNPAGHGHNYVVEVTVTGHVNPKTGMMVDLAELDNRINDLVVDRYDHKNLDVDLPEFKGKVSTSEALAVEIFGRLNGKIPATLEAVRLFETGRSSFEVRADP